MTELTCAHNIKVNGMCTQFLGRDLIGLLLISTRNQENIVWLYLRPINEKAGKQMDDHL